MPGSTTLTSQCPYVTQIMVPVPGPRSQTGTLLLCSSVLCCCSCSGVLTIPCDPWGVVGHGMGSLVLRPLLTESRRKTLRSWSMSRAGQ